MKLTSAIKYRFKYQMKFAAFFFGYFLLFSIAFPLIGIIFTGTNNNVNSDMMFASMVFMSILSYMGASSDFKLFIQNGMSRNNIFLSSIISNSILSALFSFILIGIKQFGNQLMTKLNLTLFFIDIYSKEDLITGFLLLFVFLLFFSSIASIAGIFNDRVSGFKKLFIIATLVMIPILLSLLIKISSPAFKTSLFNLVQKILGISSVQFSPLTLTLTLFIVCILLTVVTYFMNMKREIKRVNA